MFDIHTHKPNMENGKWYPHHTYIMAPHPTHYHQYYPFKIVIYTPGIYVRD